MRDTTDDIHFGFLIACTLPCVAQAPEKRTLLK
jgi:hypothetical protein